MMTWLRLVSRTLAAVGCAVLGAACGDDGDSAGTTISGSTSSAAPTTTTTTTTTDADGSSSGAVDGSSSSSSETGPAFCPASHRCVTTPPQGWSGPVVFAAGPIDRPVACGGEYPDQVTVAYADIVAPQAACSCACAGARGSACQTSATLRYYGASAICSGTPATFTTFASACNVFPSNLPPGGHWLAETVEASGGACAPAATAELDAAAFATAITTCGGAELSGGCNAGFVCAPRPADSSICIWADGSHTCPAEYPAEHRFSRGIEDTRGCTACTCGAPAGVCDQAAIQLWQTPCSGLSAGIFVANGECETANGFTVGGATFTPGAPTAFCSPSGGTPTGAATGVDRVTLCCTR